eukprot:scaffold20134_cov113-Isochrysis_galbana.AAC.2
MAPGGTAGVASGSMGHRFLKSSMSHVPQVAAHLCECAVGWWTHGGPRGADYKEATRSIHDRKPTRPSGQVGRPGQSAAR